MRIAVASSGLGHVARGIETWAMETAKALHQKGADITLFGAGGEPPWGEDGPNWINLFCLKRGDKANQVIDRLVRRPFWRLGMGGPYGLEQVSFWFPLWLKLRHGGYDILHIQDPILAWYCSMFRKAGLVKSREILAHGTEEPPEFLAKLQYVQHLAPWHLEYNLTQLKKAAKQVPAMGAGWTALPNFVDTDKFTPKGDDLRRELGIPHDCMVFGTAAAIKKHHKRIDHMLKEFCGFIKDFSGPDQLRPHLVLAGASTPETPELMRLAEENHPDLIHFLLDLPHDRMPALYRTLDVFLLTSLFEMMPIAVLESLSSSCPVISNQTPVLEWMVEPPGGGHA
jgi:glycosyltransferase involved in cell wall biosynthesis